jgi:hypothetical protein
VEHLEDRTVPAVFNAAGSPFPVGNSPQLVAVGDFNGDNRPDLATTNANDNTVSVLLGDGAGGFASAPGAPVQLGAGRSPEGITAARLRGPGQPLDLAVVTNDGSLSVLTNDGTGRFTASTTRLQTGQGGAEQNLLTYVAAGDLNNDGRLDLVVADFAQDELYVLPGDNTGRFDPQPLLQFGSNGLFHPEQIVLADFNGDSQLDIAVASQSDESTNAAVTVFRNVGQETAFSFSDPVVVFTGQGLGSTGLAAGDLDGDNRIDLAVANLAFGANPGSVSVVRNLSDANGLAFDGPRTTPVGQHLVNVAVADLDGDGRPDLAVTSRGLDGATDDKVFTLRNQGGLTFGPATPVTVGTNPSGLAAVDVNGDRAIDLVATDADSNSVSVLLNDQVPNQPGAPTVTVVTPASGPTAGGTVVTITGSNFSGATAVTFGGVAATTFTVNSATQITATAPAQAAGTVDVTVRTAAGTSAQVTADRFTYNPPAPPTAPTVTGITPASGSTVGGTTVAVTGTNFFAVALVSFGDVPTADFTIVSPTQITVRAPAHAAATVDVTVTNIDGTSARVSADRFTYTQSAPQLTPTQRYVNQAYRDLLGRDADAGGLAYFSGQLDRGSLSRFQVASILTATDEYRAKAVNDTYRALLGRDATRGPLLPWSRSWPTAVPWSRCASSCSARRSTSPGPAAPTTPS